MMIIIIIVIIISIISIMIIIIIDGISKHSGQKRDSIVKCILKMFLASVAAICCKFPTVHSTKFLGSYDALTYKTPRSSIFAA